MISKKTNQTATVNQVVGSSRDLVVEMVLADASPASAPPAKKKTPDVMKRNIKITYFKAEGTAKAKGTARRKGLMKGSIKRGLRRTTEEWKAKAAARRNQPTAATMQRQRANGSAVDLQSSVPKMGNKSENDDVVSADFSVMDLVHELAAMANDDEESDRSRTDALDPPSSPSEPGAFMGAPGRRSLHRRDNIRSSSRTEPGAFTRAPGRRSFHRRDNICFSLVGVGADHLSPTTLADGDAEDDDVREDVTNQNGTFLANLDCDTAGLAEATPVQDNITPDVEAQPFDVDASERRKSLEARKHRAKLGLILFFIIPVLATVIVLVLSNNKISNVVGGTETPTTASASTSTLRPLPPMENLELLYNELPEKTKERLYEHSSPQYQAWVWLLNHPNITAYPTWRKRQIFALVTIFFSFEGPNWPEETPARSRWIDVNSSECDWIATEYEVAFIMEQANHQIGPDAYEAEDFRPCNKDGELQFMLLSQLFLPDNLNPTMPPEIGLLTSVKMLAVMFSRINVELSDLLVPELIQLPNIEGLNFRSNGAHGTIPKEISLMTGLRHLIIGKNTVTGTFPSEIARMTSLEYLNVGDEVGVTGRLPSELGLMTRLTSLGIYRSSVTGNIPTELASLIHLREIYFDNNQMSGTIPSELSLWTNIVDVKLGNELGVEGHHNNFSGSLPATWWELSLQWLFLPNLPNLHGSIPSKIIMPNLIVLSLTGSPHITGTIPDQACLFVNQLDFDCSDSLCGCDCLCAGSINKTNPP